MKKNLFLAGALALFAIVGVSAQNWCRTLATGLPGKEITHDVNGTSVTQYRAETALIKNAGATGVRYTVVKTTATGEYGGGPFFAMGEMIVLDAAGDTINYTVTSNADHNSGGAGTDGAGLPALNDGNFNNFFHSSWGGTEPGGLHYLELTFEKSLDEFKLIWYTRPNQHVNRPQIVGLSNPGVDFTEDMLFAEYGFEHGAQVTSVDELKDGGCFTLFVQGPAEFGETTGNGDTFISLSGYATGSSAEATVQNIVQFIPTSTGKYILYQPVLGTYYANPEKWNDGYNGKNGWLRAYTEAWTLAQFDIVKANDGGFYISTTLSGRYNEGAWVDFEEPLQVWVGYDMRGQLKIFPESEKNLLEADDYESGAFHLPVDFTFDIYSASVNKEMVPDKTGQQMCDEVVAPTIEAAKEKQEEYAAYVEYDLAGAPEMLADAIEAAEKAIAEGDVAAAFGANEELKAAIAEYVAMKAGYYEEVVVPELQAKFNANNATPPYSQEDTGKYTPAAQEVIDQINDKIGEATATDDEGALAHSYSTIENLYAQIDALVLQFEKEVLYFSTFPEIVSDIPADNFPYSELPNNAVWKKGVVLANAVDGVRLTFLDRHKGNANDPGNFPMIAIGELKVYDGEGNEVTMAAENFVANHTETNEGFESTVARLCDGNFAAQGYYHSPWSGDEPQEYIYIDITFPEAMDNFTFEVYSRDKSTSGNQVSLIPKKVAITAVGEGYDPLLFAENPYSVYVTEKVTSADQITADGLYVIKGLLNTQKVLAYDEDGETIIEKDPEGTAKFYNGVSRFHASAAAVRAAGAYRFVKNADGTFKALSLGLAQYWPSTEETGFVSGTTTYEAEKAANINIVPSTNVEGAFVMYEKIDGLTTTVYAEAEEGEEVTDSTVFDTPYVMFMDWHSGLATRPVTEPQPFRDEEKLIVDGKGDALCFNKANGEGEWEIYKVTMDNPDFYWLTNLTSAFDKLGLVVGTNPGEVSNLGNLESVLAEGQRVVADSAYAEAPAAAAALAKEIAAVNSIEKNPMAPGIYQVVSAYGDFKAKQGKEKALYAHVAEDGTPTFGWKNIEEGNIQFYFDFQKVEDAEDLVASDMISEEYVDLVYTIKAIATYEGSTPYYIGEVDAQSTPVELFSESGSYYLILNSNGSAFNFRLAGKGAGFSIHAGGHSSGAGQSGNIVYWDGAPGASQWYLRKVDYETSINDFVVEGAEAVAVSYFTPAGAAVPAPVKGINVVVTVYSNGVVETKKVLVK